MPDPASTPPARCPHCHAELTAAALARGPSRKRRWLRGLLVVGVVLVGVLLLAYRYKGQIVTVLDLVNDETGSTSLSVAALALAASILAGLAGWFLLPFFLAWAYLDLRRRLGPPR
ncbi:MAG: hypothetical protein JNL97_16180 [Verrucomicrobiales bacterium]|nr:hypothetical protein [Verrucomicrobiales bacterium]